MDGGIWSANPETIRTGNSLISTSNIQSPNGPNGFTLIELIVVIALISLMLFIAVPRVHDTVFSDDTQQVSRWIVANVRNLKEVAVREQIRYALYIDLDSNRMWVSHSGMMSEEELQNAEDQGYRVPDDVDLVDVEYPQNEVVSSGKAVIRFYPKGYSARAVIHIENSSGEQWSFLIEPFLPGVKLYEKHRALEN